MWAITKVIFKKIENRTDMTWWHVLLEERYSIQGEERKIRMYERDTKIGEFKVLVIGRLCHGVSLLTEIYSFIFLEKRIYIILDSLQHFFINEEQSREGNRNWLYRRKKILSIFFETYWNFLEIKIIQLCIWWNV